MRTQFFATVAAIAVTSLVSATKLHSDSLLDAWQYDPLTLAESNSHALGYSDADIEADLEGEGDSDADIDLDADSDAEGESDAGTPGPGPSSGPGPGPGCVKPDCLKKIEAYQACKAKKDRPPPRAIYYRSKDPRTDAEILGGRKPNNDPKLKGMTAD